MARAVHGISAEAQPSWSVLWSAEVFSEYRPINVRRGAFAG